jgi:hypothetical protein
MRAKTFQLLLIKSIVLAMVVRSAVAADQTQAHFDKHHVAPLAALKEALPLMQKTKKPLVSKEEMQFFTDIANGQVHGRNVPDDMLLVSGIRSKKLRERYDAKIDQIVDDCREAVDGITNPQQKADRLVKYLYKTALKGGYETELVDMKRVLDEGKFNCVSSSVLYSVVAQQLGIKTRAITAPEHMFLRMGEGMIVEPVGGFATTPELHEKTLDKLWNEGGDKWKAMFGKARYYESGNLGLFGAIYYDNCNALAKDNHTEQAVVAAFEATCLDAKHPVYVHSLENQLINWFSKTFKAKDYTKAEKIAAIDKQLFGKSAKPMLDKIALAKKKHPGS